MWETLGGHYLVSIYALVFFVPFLLAYFVTRIRGWFGGL